MASHSTTLIITREALLELVEARTLEGKGLRSKGSHSGAMFLGGCALECLLKAAICRTLKLDGLPAVFKTHDLEALLLYSGFRDELESESAVQPAFAHIVQEWGADGRETLLYGEPKQFSVDRSDLFFSALLGKAAGVIPWLRSRI